MSAMLLTEHHLEFLNLKGAAQAHLSLHLSKCHIVGNHMSQLKCITIRKNPDGGQIRLATVATFRYTPRI